MAESDAEMMEEAKVKADGTKRMGWLRRLVRVVGYTILAYILLVCIGLIPVNNGFRSAEDGVTIFVASSSVHSDVIVPTANSLVDWREHFPSKDFKGAIERSQHVAIGWGDRGFYLETPRWSDLKISTSANAIFLPSESVMHVQFQGKPSESATCKSVTISSEAYEKLVAFILASFQTENQGISKKCLGESYGRYDAFYKAKGSYHLLNTCNCWVGRALKTSGIRTPWFSPMPRSVLLYL